MDWRRKAFVAEVDPAQLKSSVVEYLLPRMEIGLRHSDITEKICHSWTSTIIHTICRRGGMNTVTTLNSKAFLVLSGIPDLWLRTQTTRASELLVNLNTTYCECGRSTRARLCNLVKFPASELKGASSHGINKRKFCRLSSTIQYLKKLNVNIEVKLRVIKSPSS